MQELLSIIFDNRLLTFKLQDEEFVLTAAVSKFRNTDEVEFPEYLYDLHDQEEVDGEVVIGEYNAELFDPEAYLQDVFTDYIFNSALLGGGFEIEEEIFNKLIYSAAGGFAETRGTQEIPISDTENKTIEVGLKAIWFDFEEELVNGEVETNIYVNALFKIAGIDSHLVITAQNVTPDGVDDTLKFEFTEITFGKDAEENAGDYIEILDLDAFKQVFATIGDVQFGEFNADGDLVITAEKLSGLLQDGSADGAVVVAGISLQQDAIVLDVQAGDPAQQQLLEDFQQALEDVIESEELITDLTSNVTSDDPEEQEDIDEVIASVDDIQDTLATGDEVTEEQVEALMEDFDELDPETQQEFLETIGENIDPALYDQFGDIFGDFDQTEEEDVPEE
jgi:hypothetical protein